MNTPPTPHARMDSAFKNYFALSGLLRGDLSVLLVSESDSQHWRRNFIRVSASLIESYAHCLREMCVVSFECADSSMVSSETKVLRSEQRFAADERIKRSLRIAYELFELQPVPQFDGSEWLHAKRVFAKRNSLMHPKTPTDLEVAEDLWIELRQGIIWIVEQLFNFIALLQQKHSI